MESFENRTRRSDLESKDFQPIAYNLSEYMTTILLCSGIVSQRSSFALPNNTVCVKEQFHNRHHINTGLGKEKEISKYKSSNQLPVIVVLKGSELISQKIMEGMCVFSFELGSANRSESKCICLVLGFVGTSCLCTSIVLIDLLRNEYPVVWEEHRIRDRIRIIAVTASSIVQSGVPMRKPVVISQTRLPSILVLLLLRLALLLMLCGSFVLSRKIISILYLGCFAATANNLGEIVDIFKL